MRRGIRSTRKRRGSVRVQSRPRRCESAWLRDLLGKEMGKALGSTSHVLPLRWATSGQLPHVQACDREANEGCRRRSDSRRQSRPCPLPHPHMRERYRRS